MICEKCNFFLFKHHHYEKEEVFQECKKCGHVQRNKELAAWTKEKYESYAKNSVQWVAGEGYSPLYISGHWEGGKFIRHVGIFSIDLPFRFSEVPKNGPAAFISFGAKEDDTKI